VRIKRLWRWASLSIGAMLGNLEGGSSTSDFERWMKGALGMEHFSLKRLSAEGLWGGLLYWGPLEDTLQKALDTGIFLHRGPIGEPGGDSFAGTLKRKG